MPTLQLTLQHALGVKVCQLPPWVILLFKGTVLFFVVDCPKLFLRIIGVRIQGFHAAELADFFFHQPVVMAAWQVLPTFNRIPETKIYIQFARLHGIKGESGFTVQRPDRTYPDWCEPDGIKIKVQKINTFRQRDLHILDHSLAVQPPLTGPGGVLCAIFYSNA